MSRIRVLRTAKATLSRRFYLDEVGTDPTGSVVVSVTRLDGTIVESGNASAGAGPGDVTYTFGGLDVVDELVLTWSATVGGDDVILDSDRIEVVGGFYFGLAEGRAVDPVLQSTTKFPTADLIEHRIAAEDECQRITGQSWVPRFHRETVRSGGWGALQLRYPFLRAVRSISSVSGAPVGSVDFDDLGLLHLSQPVRGARYVVEYEHGHDAPNPEIARAVKQRFKSLCLEGRSALPDRAERVVTVDQQGGSITYGSPSAEKTGIPGVDAVYHRYSPPQPGFG